MKTPTFDREGSPTETTLKAIRTWKPGTPGFLEFCEEAWNKHYGKWKKAIRVTPYGSGQQELYEVSTGGWSGNEAIIGAMNTNYVKWATHWLKSERGGHYEFEIRDGV